MLLNSHCIVQKPMTQTEASTDQGDEVPGTMKQKISYGETNKEININQ